MNFKLRPKENEFCNELIALLKKHDITVIFLDGKSYIMNSDYDLALPCDISLYISNSDLQEDE